MRFRFINLISTKSEYGNTIPGDCHMCGRATEVYPMYGDICAICLDGSYFLEEVVVEEERPDDTEDGGSGSIGEIFDEWLGKLKFIQNAKKS